MLRHAGIVLSAQAGDSDRLRDLVRTRDERAEDALREADPQPPTADEHHPFFARLRDLARRKGLIKGGDRG